MAQAHRDLGYNRRCFEGACCQFMAVRLLGERSGALVCVCMHGVGLHGAGLSRIGLPALPKILPKSTSCSSPTTSSTGSTQVREVPKRAGAASQPKEHFGLRNKTLWRLFLVSYKTRQPVQTGSSPLTHNPGWEGPIAPSINTVRWPPKASVIVECRPEQRGGSSAHPQPGVPASAAAPGWVHGDFV